MQPKLNPLIKNFIFVILIFLIIGGVFSLIYLPPEKSNQISISQLAQDINQDKVKKITVSGDTVSITYNDDKTANSMKESNSVLPDLLLNLGVDKNKLQKVDVDVSAQKENVWSWLIPALIYGILPILVIGFFLWTMLKQAKSGALQVFDFTKARARIFGAEGHDKQKVTFKDVAGLKEAKEELIEIVDFLKFPKKYLAMGAKIPRGVLLMGAPGTGKTLLAKAVASEAGVPFFSISGSEFVEMFVGIGASVTGDTLVLIRTNEGTKLVPIQEFADAYYKEGEEGLRVVNDVKTLGADWARGTKFFKGSNWKNIKSVYRHKVDSIYEIEYVGGKLKTTGDHSIFVKNKNHVIYKKASELKEGDILIGLPDNVRGLFMSGFGTQHKAKAHSFPKEPPIKELTVWSYKTNDIYPSNYRIPPSMIRVLGQSDSSIAIKTAQTNKTDLVYKIPITTRLMKLLGYYGAEGWYHGRSLKFGFAIYEKDLHKDCVDLMKDVFGLNPRFYETKNNALQIEFSSVPIAEFFVKFCGKGAKNKFIPEFLWDMPKEYFISYFEGLVAGDGYINKKGLIEFSSASKRLIDELRWLLAMHGISSSVSKYDQEGGRTIRNSKSPLPPTTHWRLTIGKLTNPFLTKSFSKKFKTSAKRPIVKKITRRSYHGYVYDLCGCDNEAFFGGEKPTLLHNSRVRDLFSVAKKSSPSIIFVDELDAIGRHRGAGIGGGHDEREQTLNMILVEMDGFDKEATTIVFGATNRPDVLDPALLRPGRFDRKIILDPPDVHDREEILKIHSKEKPLAGNINFKEIAERTPGFSGADLANVANEAALLAARRNKKEVFQNEFLESIEKVLLGPERKSHLLSKKEKEIAAYHEAGHALVSSSIPGTEPVRKISIISRGMAGGYTLQIPSEENKMKTKTQFMAEIATLMGGFCAERLIFGEMTTGASNDLVRASELARKIVKEYGMSSLGPISFGDKDELVFLGREISEQRNYSEIVAAKIDKEVENIIKIAEKKAKEIVTRRKNLLEKIAKTLIEKETIEREEFEKILGIKPKK